MALELSLQTRHILPKNTHKKISKYHSKRNFKCEVHVHDCLLRFIGTPLDLPHLGFESLESISLFQEWIWLACCMLLVITVLPVLLTTCYQLVLIIEQHVQWFLWENNERSGGSEKTKD